MTEHPEPGYHEHFVANPLPMWVYDVETRAFLAVNQAAVASYGYSEDEFLAMTIKDIRPAEDLPELLDDVAGAPEFSVPTRGWRHQAKDGRGIDVEITAHALRFEGRDARLVLALDVTEQRAAEAALAAGERRWRQLIQNSSDAISVLGADGTVVFSSPAIERLFGYVSDEAAGAGMLDQVHPDDLPQAIEIFEAITNRAGPSDPLVIRIFRADGSVAWVEAVANNLLDDPDVAGIVINTRDVSDRKAAEEALVRSEEKWRRLFQHSSDVVSVIGRDGTVVSSTSGSRFFDAPVDTYEGAGLLDFVHPADAEKALTMFEQIAKEPGAGPPLEIRVADANGEWHWIEGIATNLLDDPVIEGIVVNTRNIDQRRRAEDALRESEERLRFIVQHSTDIITVVNDNGHVRYASPATESVPGYPSSGEPFIGGLSALLSDADQDDTLEVLCAQLSTPGVHEPIHLRLLAGDRIRDVELTVNNRLGDSPVAGVLVVARDITERETQKQRRIMDELFADLVMGAVDPAHLSRAHAAGLVQAAEYRALVLPLEQESRRSDDDLMNEFARQMERLNAPGSVWGTFGGLGGVILPSSIDVRGLAGQLCDALVEVFDTDRVVVAVGASKEGPAALKDALDDAIRVLTLARRRGLKGTVAGDDVVVPALLASAPNIAEELSQMLGPLASEDLRSRGELVHTLRTYLAEGLSVHRTAQTLVVHRNTVRSRLKRIESLLGGDISTLKLPLELALLATDLDVPGDGDRR